MWLTTSLYTFLTSILLSLVAVGAKPVRNTRVNSASNLIVPQQVGFPLRILPLGASIT